MTKHCRLGQLAAALAFLFSLCSTACGVTLQNGGTPFTSDLYYYYLSQGKAYGNGASVSGVAGQNSIFALFNPAGSGKTVAVRNISASLGAAGTIVMTTLTSDPAFSSLSALSLSVGSANGVAKYESGTSASPTGTIIWSYDVPASTAYQPSTNWVIYLPPGTGIEVYALSQNVLLRCSMQWLEF